MVTNELKGYMDDTNVCLTNEKFKGFRYKKDCNKNFNAEFKEWVKIDVTHFKNIIDFLYKSGYEKFNLKIEGNKLIIFYDCLNSFKFELELINKESDGIGGLYSVEYIYTFLKNFKKKELKEEFINLYYASDYPLLLDIADLNKWCLIAPRVEQN